MTVIDFTQMTGAEIIRTLEARAGQRTCGRMRQEMKSYSLSPVLITNAHRFRMPGMGPSIYTLSIAALLLSSCQNNAINPINGQIIGIDSLPVEFISEYPDASSACEPEAPQCAKDSVETPEDSSIYPQHHIELTGEVAVDERLIDKMEPEPNDRFVAGKVAFHPDDTLFVTEKMPFFPGGEKAMISYIRKHINYPKVEKDSAIEGRVVASFVVDTGGKINNIQIVRSVPNAPGFDKEVIRILESMPLWIPGEDDRGRKQFVRLALPFQFQLD